MSSFNKANELASELCGETYDGEALSTPRPEHLVFVNGDSTAVVTATGETHGKIAHIIEHLLHDGYWLGCDMDVSWNGRYDTDGDPVPDKNYLPCRKPVSVRLDGRHLCDKHDLTDYKAKWLAAQQCGRTLMNDLLQSMIREYEQERERHASDEETVALYDRLIAALKKRHVCMFRADNDFKCPTCGEEL